MEPTLPGTPAGLWEINKNKERESTLGTSKYKAFWQIHLLTKWSKAPQSDRKQVLTIAFHTASIAWQFVMLFFSEVLQGQKRGCKEDLGIKSECVCLCTHTQRLKRDDEISGKTVYKVFKSFKPLVPPCVHFPLPNTWRCRGERKSLDFVPFCPLQSLLISLDLNSLTCQTGNLGHDYVLCCGED